MLYIDYLKNGQNKQGEYNFPPFKNQKATLSCYKGRQSPIFTYIYRRLVKHITSNAIESFVLKYSTALGETSATALYNTHIDQIHQKDALDKIKRAFYTTDTLLLIFIKSLF